tara:strand:+ start:6240 stop:6569 length:330 start_codon:yes stop_codon:yes gene_type:complete
MAAAEVAVGGTGVGVAVDSGVDVDVGGTGVLVGTASVGASVAEAGAAGSESESPHATTIDITTINKNGTISDRIPKFVGVFICIFILDALLGEFTCGLDARNDSAPVSI